MKKRTRRALEKATSALTLAAGFFVADAVSQALGGAIQRGARVALKRVKKVRKKSKQR